MKTSEQYEKLLEDLHDLAIVAQRRGEKPISLEEMKRRLESDENTIGKAKLPLSQ